MQRCTLRLQLVVSVACFQARWWYVTFVARNRLPMYTSTVCNSVAALYISIGLAIKQQHKQRDTCAEMPNGAPDPVAVLLLSYLRNVNKGYV